MAAKVTRDACIEGWVFEEGGSEDSGSTWSKELGSGYPSGEVVLSVLNYSGLICLDIRPENTSMDKEFYRPNIRVPLPRPILMDNSQSGPRKGRT